MNDRGTTVPADAGLSEAGLSEAGFSEAGLARLRAAMEREVAAGRAPGVSMLISRRGETAWRADIGALRPGGPPMPTDGIFRIYSMTKPIVSVVAMMLVEEGRLLLPDPVAKYIPEFADVKVGVEAAGKLDLVAPRRPMTVHDLLRHTSGLTYGFLGASAVQHLYLKAPLRSQDITSAEHARVLASLPLLNQPGASWDYSHSTDVLGRIVEIVEGGSLGDILARRILGPLRMRDTGFHVPPGKHDRLAEAFSVDPDTSEAVQLIETRAPPSFESGGGGLVSTVGDYARFVHMLYRGGTLDGERILGRKTLAFMTANHLDPHVRIGSELLQPGHGFGLGFAVRLAEGLAPVPGTVGEFFWGGIAGTAFWVAPREELCTIMMIQAPGRRDYFRQLFRNLVHAALT